MRKQAYLDNNKIGAENLTNNSESNDMGQGLPELMDCKQSGRKTIICTPTGNICLLDLLIHQFGKVFI